MQKLPYTQVAELIKSHLINHGKLVLCHPWVINQSVTILFKQHLNNQSIYSGKYFFTFQELGDTICYDESDKFYLLKNGSIKMNSLEDGKGTLLLI